MNRVQPSRRRWFQISLRTLLALTILTGVGTGWFGLHYERLRRQTSPDRCALDPPTDADVIQALAEAKSTSKVVPVNRRSGLRIVKEMIADYVDPPRFVPMIGPAQLHHVHYKCTVYTGSRATPKVEIVYIDHQHFHTVGDGSGRAAQGDSDS